MSFITIFIVVFYEISIKLRYVFNPLKTVYRQISGQDPAILKLIYIPVIKIWSFFIFIIIFHIFIISVYISLNRIICSIVDTFFLPLITYRYQLIDPILLCFFFLFVFFLRLLAMLILVQKKNEQDQAHFKEHILKIVKYIS